MHAAVCIILMQARNEKQGVQCGNKMTTASWFELSRFMSADGYGIYRQGKVGGIMRDGLLSGEEQNKQKSTNGPSDDMLQPQKRTPSLCPRNDGGLGDEGQTDTSSCSPERKTK